MIIWNEIMANENMVINNEESNEEEGNNVKRNIYERRNEIIIIMKMKAKCNNIKKI